MISECSCLWERVWRWRLAWRKNSILFPCCVFSPALCRCFIQHPTCCSNMTGEWCLRWNYCLNCISCICMWMIFKLNLVFVARVFICSHIAGTDWLLKYYRFKSMLATLTHAGCKKGIFFGEFPGVILSHFSSLIQVSSGCVSIYSTTNDAWMDSVGY